MGEILTADAKENHSGNCTGTAKKRNSEGRNSNIVLLGRQFGFLGRQAIRARGSEHFKGKYGEDQTASDLGCRHRDSENLEEKWANKCKNRKQSRGQNTCKSRHTHPFSRSILRRHRQKKGNGRERIDNCKQGNRSKKQIFKKSHELYEVTASNGRRRACRLSSDTSA